MSSPKERDDVVAAGADPRRVRIRTNAFPEPPPPLDVDPLAGVVPERRAGRPLRGRIAAEKGIEHLVEAARRLPEVHVVLAGPDDRHGTLALVDAARADPRTAGRVHLLPATPGPPFDLYRRADVFVLASGGENFGLVAAEAASVGTAVIVSDRTGIASSFADGEALVVPYRPEATVEAIDAHPRRRRAPATARRGSAPRREAVDLGRRRRRAARALRGGARGLDAGGATRRTTSSSLAMLGS